MCVLIIAWPLLGTVLEGNWSFALTTARLLGAVPFIVTCIALFGLPRALPTYGLARQEPWASRPILTLMTLPFTATTIEACVPPWGALRLELGRDQHAGAPLP